MCVCFIFFYSSLYIISKIALNEIIFNLFCVICIKINSMNFKNFGIKNKLNIYLIKK